jgi:hypothetical protein
VATFNGLDFLEGCLPGIAWSNRLLWAPQPNIAISGIGRNG